MPCGVMLKSLIINNSDTEIHCHAIINKDVTEDDKASLMQIVGNENTMNFYPFKKELLDYYPGLRGTHYGEAIYYRLFCASILPKNIDKILYLDSDMIICDSLLPLWNVDIGNNAMGAVINPCMEREELKPFKINKYVNSGVLLINLHYWREQNVGSQFVQVIKQNTHQIVYPDQDVLNILFKDLITYLPIRYNLTHIYLYKEEILNKYLGEQLSELHDAWLKPAIVHYTGPIKPWMSNCNHPLRLCFRFYLEMTQWSNQSDIRTYHWNDIKREIKMKTRLLLRKLGLIKEQETVYDMSVCETLYKRSLIKYKDKYHENY